MDKSRKQNEPPPRPENLAPHSVEAEEAVIGSVLINPDVIQELSFLSASDFFIQRNAWVWETLLSLAENQEPIDYITVNEDLRSKKAPSGKDRLDEIGGAAYITYLINNTPYSIYAEAYGRIVERAAIRRRLLSAASKIAQLAHETDADIHQVVASAHVALDDAAQASESSELVSLERGVSEYFDSVENAANVVRIKTRFSDLDDLVGGVANGDLVIIAGRPGMGKTALMLTILSNVVEQFVEDSEDSNSPGFAMYFSLEMSSAQIVQRLISQRSGIRADVLRNGKLNSEDWSELLTVMADLAPLPIVIDDRATLTVRDIRAACAKAVRDYGDLFGPLRLVIVDYAQLMSVEADIAQARRFSGELDRNTYLSKAFKELARTLNIPLFVAAQLNRDVEKGVDKRPKLHHLRGSGTYEQDADQILMLYRDEVYNPNTESPSTAEIIVAKNRHGPTGTVMLFWSAERTWFSNLQRQSVDLGELSSSSWVEYPDFAQSED